MALGAVKSFSGATSPSSSGFFLVFTQRRRSERLFGGEQSLRMPDTIGGQAGEGSPRRRTWWRAAPLAATSVARGGAMAQSLLLLRSV
jgi:hypothetical protein